MGRRVFLATRFFLQGGVALYCVMSLKAEVITTKAGSLMIGKITGRSATTADIMAFGHKHVVETQEILSTTDSIGPYIKRKILVILTDTSIVRGRLRDYSEEVGLYVDSEMGPLTIPVDKIDHIIFDDSEMAKTPPLVIYRLGLLAHVSFAPVSDTMRSGMGGTFLGELPVPSRWVPTIGLAASYESITASQAALRFSEMIAYVYARHAFFPLAGIFQRLGFSFTFGGGTTFTQIHDTRANNLSPNAEIQGLVVFKTGLEVFAAKSIRLRLDFANFLRTVRGGNLWKPAIELGVTYAL